MQHLDELRSRLIVSVLALVVATLASLIFTSRLFDLLKEPLPQDVKLIYTAPMEMIGTYFKVSLYAGVILAMPVLLYEVVAFVAPALTRKERRYFFALLPGIFLCFAAGVLFGYKVVLPTALPYLLGLFMDIAQPWLRIGEYISFVSTLLFWLGIAFQTPLVIYMLAKLHIVTPKKLASMRKFAIVLAFVLGAVITPTPDPINQTIVSVPIYLLFEIGILLARFA
ncbi:MAG: twin-arginine translocase subunit TatC [Chloroflexi bacterium]|nr:twin-arginine translocase subunit TatC [Chloroflexota bacterium]